MSETPQINPDSSQKSSPPEVVEAKEFRLVDDEGRTRARLGMNNVGHPLFSLLDEVGEIKVRLTLMAEGNPSLSLHSGTKSIHLLIDGKENMFLSMADTEFQSKAFMVLSESGVSSIVFLDCDGEVRSALGIGRNGKPSFTLNRSDESEATRSEDVEPETKKG